MCCLIILIEWFILVFYVVEEKNSVKFSLGFFGLEIMLFLLLIVVYDGRLIIEVIVKDKCYEIFIDFGNYMY